MRKINYIFILIALVGVCLNTSCKKAGNKESEEEVKTKQLSKAWKITEFKADGVTKDLAANAPVVITFTSAKTYTISSMDWLNTGYNHSAVLKAAGTWAFSEGLGKVVLDGNKELIITELNDNSFKFSYMSSFPKPADTEKTMLVTTVPN